MADVKPLIGILMGSDSDLPVMNKAVQILKDFGIDYEMRVISAHRNPDDCADYSKNAARRGLKVIIAGAGGAAHLPGVLAGNTILPVIGIPVMTKSLGGLDSLYSIVQMPPGVPVASVGIDGAKNAALLAVQILATSDDDIKEKFVQYKKDTAEASRKKNEGPDFTPIYE